MITPSSVLGCGGIGTVTIASYGSQIKLRLFKIAQISIFETVQTESRHRVDRSEMGSAQMRNTLHSRRRAAKSGRQAGGIARSPSLRNTLYRMESKWPS
jgi:hypothetical protein